MILFTRSFPILRMGYYEFVTNWHIDAPVEAVWNVIEDANTLAAVVERCFECRRVERG